MNLLIITDNISSKIIEDVLVDSMNLTEDEYRLVDASKPFNLQELITVHSPGVIITAGEKALNMITGKTTISRYVGKKVELDDFDVPVFPVYSPSYIEYNPSALLMFAEDIYRAYQASIGIVAEDATNQTVTIEDVLQVWDLVEHIKKTGILCFDFETKSLTDLGTFDPEFYATTLSISFQQGSSYVIPLYHKESKLSDAAIKNIVKILNPVFSDPNIIKVGQNIKFDLHVATWLGIKNIRGPFYDTMVMHHLLFVRDKHDLKSMVRWHYPKFSDYEAEVKKSTKFEDVELNTLIKYNSLDSDLTLRMYWRLLDLLLEDEKLYVLFRNLSTPLVKVLFEMEQHGMLIDKEYILDALSKVEKIIIEHEANMRSFKGVQNMQDLLDYKYEKSVIEKMEKEIQKIESKKETELKKEFKTEAAKDKQAAKLASFEHGIEAIQFRILHGRAGSTTDIDFSKAPQFNFSSPLQVSELLFGSDGFKFDTPVDPRTGQKDNSTNKENLDLIDDESGFVDALLAYRQMQKIYSTYLLSIKEKMDSNHMIHSTFNPIGTITGRISSKNPNLQNIISRTKYEVVEEMVKYVKTCFISPEGYDFYQGDYSQAELRIIAEFANETNMLKAYNSGQDLHELTAAGSRNFTLEEFKKLPEKDYKQYRFEAKAENFGFIYSMTPQGFQQYARVQYGIRLSVAQCEKKQKNFFKQYPKLLDYHRLYKAKAMKFGYVRTLFGRKVDIPDIYSVNSLKKFHAEGNAINAPIQGTAGEMTLFAVIMLKLRYPELRIVNSIHDSIIFYIPTDKVSEIVPVIKETMENLPTEEYFGKSLKLVQMKVDFESGHSWGKLEEIKL
jgi:DNA polymerase I-like protein with 3'-5' exonuclease and polymerase domains